jgi:hypothetical protein
MAIMIGLLLFSEFSAVQPPFLNYLGIFSPIIITLAFVLAFQHFQVILQNVQQFETLLFVENNVKLTNVKPEI